MRHIFSGLTISLVAIPALVLAQQAAPTKPSVPIRPAAPSAASTPVQTPPVVPAVAPVAASEPTPPSTTTPEITVNIGGGPRTGGLAPLPKVDIAVPAGVSPTAPIPPAPPAPLITQATRSAPPARLTPAQIAQQIAPNFNVQRDYVRLTQCYGTADFMGAVTRIQASRPGANAQIVNVARSIIALQDAMQPMVLAASTVRTEARFRADYDAIARRGQQELATSKTPNATMQRRLATLDACRADVVRWRGGR